MILSAMRATSIKLAAYGVAALLGLALASAGCAGVTAATMPVEVYRSLGSKQCEGGGKTAAQLRAQLEAAKVRVRAATCGRDGRMHPAMCGAGDGKIAILSIDAKDLPRARAAGFGALTDLPGARREACDLDEFPPPPDETRR